MLVLIIYKAIAYLIYLCLVVVFLVHFLAFIHLFIFKILIGG